MHGRSKPLVIINTNDGVTTKKIGRLVRYLNLVKDFFIGSLDLSQSKKETILFEFVDNQVSVGFSDHHYKTIIHKIRDANGHGHAFETEKIC
ncbi:6638_t:CDS:2 [Funneliformis mosseae]|uniref:6638_t:CDS:1 n=1 Tax=Funneliformis mosseae TaxID=27381 RepID=A0A9N9GRC2_FUNMO|nr:6638_t:CDS:2 [Funneliformis mosseae]